METGKCLLCAFRHQRLTQAPRSSLRNSQHRLTQSSLPSRSARRTYASYRPFTRQLSEYRHQNDRGRGEGTGPGTKRIPGIGPGRGKEKGWSLGGGSGPGGSGRRGGDKGSRLFNSYKPKFTDIFPERLKAVKGELADAPIAKQQNPGDPPFNQLWRDFVATLDPSKTTNSSLLTKSPGATVSVIQSLRDAFYERGINSLDDRIKYAFYDHVTGSRFTPSDIRNQKALADLRYPTEWFPATRTRHREIHLHVGPTNSGKTYHALKRLEQAESGVYAGPLRLLAHEVYTRMNAQGKRCTLITGEERRSPDDSLTAPMQSCTVEMMPLNRELDVAVIDEIQMIGSADRGWAWTQAVLGVKARELHLCGEARTVPLVREICASIGEKLHVHEYTRLSPLKMSDKALEGDLKALRKGDCIVSFSVMGIHALRKQIEEATGRKVATVYGSLPPETRAQQARLFNDPDNDYDFLVASDAIGMGLNLSIKRIIFESSSKFDGFRQRTLSIADIKQIGGRAGRYKSAHQANESAKAALSVAAAKGEEVPPLEGATEPSKADEASKTPSSPVEKSSPDEATTTMGLVTTLEKFDFPVIAAAMKGEPEPIRTAGIFPPAAIVERFATYFPPGTPFSYILLRLHELSQMHSRFHLCGLRDQLWIADLIEPAQGLTTTDRNILCACPAGKTDSELWKVLMPAFARCIEQQRGGSLLDMPEMPLETLEMEMSASRDYLRKLERLHKAIVAYLWLSYRFNGIFTTRPLAFHVKTIVEEKIEQVLSQFSFTAAQRKKITSAREQSILKSLQQQAGLGAQSSGEESTAAQFDPDTISPPDDQTSYIAGGDQFGGEEDALIMDPAESVAIEGSSASNEAPVDEPEPKASSDDSSDSSGLWPLSQANVPGRGEQFRGA